MGFKKSVGIAGRNNATLNLVNIIDTRSYAAVEAYDRSIAERAQKFAEELLENTNIKQKRLVLNNVNVIVDYGSPKTMISRIYQKN